MFGPKAKDNEDIRGMLNAGHRKGAVAGRCVVRGKIVETEELPAYCAVAIAGLDDLPDTLMSRSVVVRMRRRAPSERCRAVALPGNAPEADRLGLRLANWSSRFRSRPWICGPRCRPVSRTAQRTCGRPCYRSRILLAITGPTTRGVAL